MRGLKQNPQIQHDLLNQIQLFEIYKSPTQKVKSIFNPGIQPIHIAKLQTILLFSQSFMVSEKDMLVTDIY